MNNNEFQKEIDDLIRELTTVEQENHWKDEQERKMKEQLCQEALLQFQLPKEVEDNLRWRKVTLEHSIVTISQYYDDIQAQCVVLQQSIEKAADWNHPVYILQRQYLCTLQRVANKYSMDRTSLTLELEGVLMLINSE